MCTRVLYESQLPDPSFTVLGGVTLLGGGAPPPPPPPPILHTWILGLAQTVNGLWEKYHIKATACHCRVTSRTQLAEEWRSISSSSPSSSASTWPLQPSPRGAGWFWGRVHTTAEFRLSTTAAEAGLMAQRGRTAAGDIRHRLLWEARERPNLSFIISFTASTMEAIIMEAIIMEATIMEDTIIMDSSRDPAIPSNKFTVWIVFAACGHAPISQINHWLILKSFFDTQYTKYNVL